MTRRSFRASTFYSRVLDCDDLDRGTVQPVRLRHVNLTTLINLVS